MRQALGMKAGARNFLGAARQSLSLQIDTDLPRFKKSVPKMRSPILLAACLLLCAGPFGPARAETMSKAQIIAEGEKVADAQLAQLAGKPADIKWVAGGMWTGYADFSHVAT